MRLSLGRTDRIVYTGMMAIYTLGQSGTGTSMLFWILALIAVALLGGLIIFTIRRRMLSHDDSISIGSSGLMDYIRQLHESGEIDDDEFSRARSAILRQVQEDVDNRKESKTKPNPLDLGDLDIDP